MNTNELQNLINIRSYVIECHNSLDGKHSATSAVIKQEKVAYDFANIIKMLDEVLSGHVKFD